ncbi:hypothetical protein M8J77_003745 [Diaphorina citri]|nr:hypothetical protein M8J77_003745 [Diaphorina citri]
MEHGELREKKEKTKEEKKKKRKEEKKRKKNKKEEGMKKIKRKDNDNFYKMHVNREPPEFWTKLPNHGPCERPWCHLTPSIPEYEGGPTREERIITILPGL